MRIQIRGANNFVITSAIEEYIQSKVGSLEKFIPQSQNLEARVNVKIYDLTQKVEVTIPGKQFILRAEESHNDLYAAIDLVVDKLERQIRKHKTKANRKIREREGIKEYFSSIGDEIEIAVEESAYKVKHVHLKPMDVEEAIMQMELLGHDFYVYRDQQVDAVCVLYSREDGHYGVIETNH